MSDLSPRLDTVLTVIFAVVFLGLVGAGLWWFDVLLRAHGGEGLLR